MKTILYSSAILKTTLLMVFILLMFQSPSNAQQNNKIPVNWELKEEDDSWNIEIERYRLDKKLEFQAFGNKGDAIFIDDNLIYYFTKQDSLEWDRNVLLGLFGPKNEIKLTYLPGQSGKDNPCSFNVEEKKAYQPINIQKVTEQSSNRTLFGLLLIGLVVFLVVLKLLFPAFFSFVFTSLRSSMESEGSADLNIGAIFISLTISAAIFSMVWVNGLGVFEWSKMILAFGAILTFVFFKFLLNQFMIFMMEKPDLLTGFFVDWLFNIFRMSFVLVLIYIFIGLLAIEVTWFYRISPLVVIIIPTLISIYSGIKSVKLLPFNYLFLYLCALEILPTLVLTKAL